MEHKDKTRQAFVSGNASVSVARSEEERESRYSRLTLRKNPGFHYGMTNDPALLHLHGLLCHSLFNRITGLSAESKNAHISLLASFGRQCVGGVQVMVSSPRQTLLLPCEQGGFHLQNQFPELDLYNVVYGEMLNFAALPEYQDEIAAELFHHLLTEAALQRVQYLFMVSTAIEGERCQRIAKPFRIACTLRHDIALPDYPETGGAQAFLTVFDLTTLVTDAKPDYLSELKKIEFNT